MSAKYFIFQDFDKDSALYRLSRRVQRIHGANDEVDKIYKNYSVPFFGQDKHIDFLMKLNTGPIVLASQPSFVGSPMQERIPSMHTLSTSLEENANISTLQRSSWPFDNAGGKASQTQNRSLEKKKAQAKIIPSTKNRESAPQECLSFDRADKDASKAVAVNWKKRLIFDTTNQNAREPENFPHGQKSMDNAKFVNSEALPLLQQQANIIGPKVDNSILSPITKPDKKVTSYNTPEQGKQKHKLSDEMDEITDIFTKKMEVYESPLKRTKVDSFESIERSGFSDSAISLLSSGRVETDNHSVATDNSYSTMSSISLTDSKSFPIIKRRVNAKVYWPENSCPVDYTIPFQSSGTVESDNPSATTGNPCSTMSSISLTDGKSFKIIKRSADKKKSPKDISVSKNISKPQCSRNLFPSETSSSTRFSPIQAKSKDRLSDKPSKKSLPRGPCDYVSPQSRDSLMQIIRRLNRVVTEREAGLRFIYDSLLKLRKNVEFICNQVREMVEVAHLISIAHEDKDTEGMEFSILELLGTTSDLLMKLDSIKLGLDIDIRYWIIYFQKIRKIRSLYEPLSCGQMPLVTITVLQEYEGRLLRIWNYLDQMINNEEGRRMYFYPTFEEFSYSLELFLKCMYAAGILIEL